MKIFSNSLIKIKVSKIKNPLLPLKIYDKKESFVLVILIEKNHSIVCFEEHRKYYLQNCHGDIHIHVILFFSQQNVYATSKRMIFANVLLIDPDKCNLLIFRN